MDDTSKIEPQVPAQCGKCATAAAPGASFCMKCGAALGQSGEAAPFVVQTQPPAVVSPPKKAELAALSWLKILVALGLGCLAPLLGSRGAPPAVQVGYYIGSLLIPFIVAFLVAQWKAHPLQTFSNWFLGGALVLVLITLNSALQNWRSTPSPGDIMREAAGAKSVEHTGTADEDKMHDIVVSFLHDMLESRKAFDASRAQMKPDLALLHTVSSFGSTENIEHCIATTDRLLNLDRQLLKDIDDWPDKIAAKVNASDLSASDKESFLSAFTKGYLDSEMVQVKKSLFETEIEWATATKALYQFALQNRKQIRVKADKIVITDNELQRQFDLQQSNCNELYDKVHVMRQKVSALDNSVMQQTGVSKSDLGLK